MSKRTYNELNRSPPNHPNNNNNYNRNYQYNNRQNNNNNNSNNSNNNNFNNFEPAYKRHKTNQYYNNQQYSHHSQSQTQSSSNAAPAKRPQYNIQRQTTALPAICGVAPSSDQKMVAQHYDARHDGDVQQRDNSSILELRKINNWTKSVLIDMFCHSGSTVLDLAGGKGGDLNKYAAQRIDELVLVDHAINSVCDCMRRYNESIEKNRIHFPLTLIAADAFCFQMSKALDDDIYFDLVSSQFAIHYAFETEQRVKAMLTNVTERLREDGHFIGTIPDCNVLVAKWRRENPGKHDFGNTKYSVKFLCGDDNMKINKKLWHKNGSNKNSKSTSQSIDNDEDDDENEDIDLVKNEKNEFDPFSIKYLFNLNDAVDCPEYLLHFDTFVKLAAQEPYNLELVLDCNFHEFFARYCNHPQYRRLLQKVGIINFDGRTHSIDNHQWDVAYLYKVFAFRKKKKNQNKTQTYPTRNKPIIKQIFEDDLKVY